MTPGKTQRKATRTSVDASLTDLATLYTRTMVDNGFGEVETDAVREGDVPCRAMPLQDEQVDEGIRVSNARYFTVAFSHDATIAMNERIDVSAAGISGGRVIALNDDRSTDKLAILATVAVVG